MVFESHRLSPAARKAIHDCRQSGLGLGISDFTLLELARLHWQGRIHIRASLDPFLEEIGTMFEVLRMTGKVCAQAFDLPASFPKDPADRVIVATALVYGLPLITSDRAIRRSRACTTIW